MLFLASLAQGAKGYQPRSSGNWDPHEYVALGSRDAAPGCERRSLPQTSWPCPQPTVLTAPSHQPREFLSPTKPGCCRDESSAWICLVLVLSCHPVRELISIVAWGQEGEPALLIVNTDIMKPDHLAQTLWQVSSFSSLSFSTIGIFSLFIFVSPRFFLVCAVISTLINLSHILVLNLFTSSSPLCLLSPTSPTLFPSSRGLSPFPIIYLLFCSSIIYTSVSQIRKAM